MTSRDILLRVLGFQPGPRAINWEFGCWGGKLQKWCDERLFLEQDMARTFGFDAGFTFLQVNQRLCPRFAERVLKQTDRGCDRLAAGILRSSPIDIKAEKDFFDVVDCCGDSIALTAAIDAPHVHQRQGGAPEGDRGGSPRSLGAGSTSTISTIPFPATSRWTPSAS